MTRAYRSVLAVAACAGCLLSMAGPASAKRYSIPAARQHRNVAVFDLKRVHPVTIYSARVVVGRHRRSISPRRVWKGIERGELRVRLSRRAMAAARARGKRKRPRLIVHGAPASPPAGDPPAAGAVPSDPAPADPAPPGDPVPTDRPDPAPTGPKSTLREARSPILSDAEAAGHVRRSTWEPRPGNAVPNHRVPTASELSAWRSTSNYRGVNNGSFYLSHASGGFTGTTDEILQWAAWKWGFEEDIVRAQATNESRWYQSAVGDSGISFGLLQLKSTIQKGTFPLSRDATAFNVDYALMMLRHCYDGYATWLGNGYKAGDYLGCLGYFFSGHWYDDGAKAYIDRIQRYLAARDWEQPGF